MRARLAQVNWPWSGLERQVAMTSRGGFANTRGVSIPTNSSPGLEAALTSLPKDGSCQVLDLGSAVGGNFAFFSSFARRIEIVDLPGHGFRSDRTVHVELDEASARIQKLIQRQQGTFHMVLVWDLLNYMSYEKGRILVEQLAQLCKPDGKLFAMIVNSEMMPVLPNRYQIIDKSTLAYESKTSDICGSPQFAPAAVESLLKGFRLEHSFVLRHGIREYVASRG